VQDEAEQRVRLQRQQRQGQPPDGEVDGFQGSPEQVGAGGEDGEHGDPADAEPGQRALGCRHGGVREGRTGGAGDAGG
jgi:hypothetical protein